MYLPMLFTALTLTTLSQALSIPIRPWPPFPYLKRHHSPKIGHAIITNNCLDPIYIWSVGSSPGAQTTVKSLNAYNETYRVDKDTGGIAIKITAVKNGLYNNAPQLILAYDLDLPANLLYYDLSEQFGSPFRGRDVRLFAEGDGESSDGQAVADWKDGVQPAGMRVRVLEPDRDLNLTIC